MHLYYLPEYVNENMWFLTIMVFAILPLLGVFIWRIFFRKNSMTADELLHFIPSEVGLDPEDLRLKVMNARPGQLSRERVSEMLSTLLTRGLITSGYAKNGYLYIQSPAAKLLIAQSLKKA